MSRAPLRRLAIALSMTTAGILCPLFTGSASANPAGTSLVINEAYVNGGSSGASYLNKFVELYNPTASAIVADRRHAAVPRPHEHGRTERRAGVRPVRDGRRARALPDPVAGQRGDDQPGPPLPTPDLSTGGSVNPGAGGGTLFVAASASGVLPDRRFGHRQDRLGYQQLAGGHRRHR